MVRRNYHFLHFKKLIIVYLKNFCKKRNPQIVANFRELDGLVISLMCRQPES